MRLLKIILALYLIVVAGYFVVSSVISIGETLPTVTVIEALVAILLTVPLFILGYIVIRYDVESKNKEYEKKIESLLEKVDNATIKIEQKLNNIP